METERLLGEILHYDKKRAFGFINSLNDNTAFFFHISFVTAVNGTRVTPCPGDLFTFVVRESRRTPGKLDATDLVLSKRGTATPTTAINAAVSVVSEVKS